MGTYSAFDQYDILLIYLNTIAELQRAQKLKIIWQKFWGGGVFLNIPGYIEAELGYGGI